MDFEALWLTIRLAVATTAVLMVVAIPLAWWIARNRGLLRAMVQAVVALPLVLPPTVIGFYLLVGLGPLTSFGRGIGLLLGHPLAFSFTGLLVGSLFYSLPFAVQPLVAGFQSIDRGFIEAAQGLGQSPLLVFIRVVLPLSRLSLLTSAVLAFTHTMGEFGVVLMVGGNLPGVTRTLSIALYDRVEDGDYTGANAIAILLLAFSLVALFFVYVWTSVQDRRIVHAG